MLYGPDGNILRSDKSGPVEIDLADLDQNEQLTIMWLRSIQPGAQAWNITDFQQRILGLSTDAVDRMLLAGIDGLLHRGFLAPARDAQGNVISDARGRPAVDVVGKLVSRMRTTATAKTAR